MLFWSVHKNSISSCITFPGKCHYLYSFTFIDLFPYQYGIGVIAVLSRVGFVHSQADAVADDGEEDQELEGFPLNQGNTMFSQWILEGQTSHGLLSPVWWGLGSQSPGGLLLSHGLDA